MRTNGVVKVVSQKRTWYERLLAAIFYSIAAYIIFMFYLNNSVSFTEEYYHKSFTILAGLIFIVSFGVRFSYIVNHHFNFDFMKYRVYWSVGPFGVGKWQSFEKLDRVSTFLNTRNVCEVNIWDIRNNKYKISTFDEIDEAVNYGRDLAKKLNVRFKERK